MQTAMQQVLKVVFTSLHTPRQQYESNFFLHFVKKEKNNELQSHLYKGLLHSEV